MESPQPVQPGGVLLPITTTTPMAQTGSVRGKPLSPNQKERLIRLALQYKTANYFAAHTKRFWIRISDLFTHASGREYSWQSCRRCMCAWECANQKRLQEINRGSWEASDEMLNGDIVQSPEPYEPSPATGDNPTDVDPYRNMWIPGSPRGYDAGEDDLLPKPPVPPLRRGQTGPIRAIDAELVTPRTDLSGPFVDRLEAFQSELRQFTGAFFEEARDCREIHLAFDKFRDELEKGIRKGGRDGS